MTFDEYQAQGGQLEESDFDALLPKVTTLFLALIAQRIPYWKTKSSLDDYGLDLDAAMTLEIDHINNTGGADVFNGASDLVFKSATTSGFSYKVDTSKQMDYYGIPLNPLAMQLLETALLKAGYGNGVCPVW